MTCGVPCAKKVLDNCGVLGAEAVALASENHHSLLTAEAKALVYALEKSYDAFSDLYYNVDEDAQKRMVEESYKACDYAAKLRKDRDDFNGRTQLGGHNFKGWAMELRGWRDEIMTLFQSIAEEYLKEGEKKS